ncbi:MAG: GNAT family N-acetyltransferase, partial [Bdellovibrionales bacterium]
MEGPISPKANELDQVIDFLDKALRSKVDWSIQAEYPTAFSEENIRNVRVIKDKDRYLSHAVWKPVIVKTPAAIYKIACIGSVVT